MIAAINLVLNMYSLVIIARVLMSWIPLDRSNPTVDQIVTVMYDITEPVMRPVREALPQTMGFDFSPIIVLIGIRILQRLLISAF